MDAGKPKLLDQMKNAIRIKHYSLQTEKSYVQWVRRYIYFHNKRHPDETGRGSSVCGRHRRRYLRRLVPLLLPGSFGRLSGYFYL